MSNEHHYPGVRPAGIKPIAHYSPGFVVADVLAGTHAKPKSPEAQARQRKGNEARALAIGDPTWLRRRSAKIGHSPDIDLRKDI